MTAARRRGTASTRSRPEDRDRGGEDRSTAAAAQESRATPAGTGSARFLAGVATALWRAEKASATPDGTEPSAEVRRVLRHLQAARDALDEGGVEIVDQEGQPFDSGMSLKVVAFQPTPGLEREMVIETIRPTVYFQRQAIQMGEVIVGTPQPESPPEGGDANGVPGDPGTEGSGNESEDVGRPSDSGPADGARERTGGDQATSSEGEGQ